MAISSINTECKRYGCIKNLLACYANCRYSTRCDDLRNEIVSKTEQASSDINRYLNERGRTPIVIQLMKRGLKFSEATIPDNRPGSNKKLSGSIKGSDVEIPSAAVKSVQQTANEIVPEDKPAKASAKRIEKNRKKSPKLRTVRLKRSKEADTRTAMAKVGKTQAASYLEKSPAPLRKKEAAKQKPHFSNPKRKIAGQASYADKLANVIMKNRKSIAMPRRRKNESNAAIAEKEQVINSTAQETESSANGKAMMTRPARSKKRSAAAKGRAAERNAKVYIVLEGKSASVVDEHGLMMHLFTNPSSSARYFEASEVEARVQITKK